MEALENAFETVRVVLRYSTREDIVLRKLFSSSNNSWSLGRFAVIYKSLRSKTPVPGGSRLERSNRIPDGSRLPVIEPRIIASATSPAQAALVYSVDSPPVRAQRARYLITAYGERSI